MLGMPAVLGMVLGTRLPLLLCKYVTRGACALSTISMPLLPPFVGKVAHLASGVPGLVTFWGCFFLSWLFFVTNTSTSTIVVMTKITPAITATGTIIAGLVGVGVAVAVVVHVDSIDPEGESKNISSRLAVERIQAGPHSFCANDVAILNILDMSVTRDTTHFEMSWLNEVASKNIPLMSSTCDTFHSDMSWLKRVAW